METKRFILCMAAISAFAFYSNPVKAMQGEPGAHLVKLFGTVQRINNDREFILHDSKGPVVVRVDSERGVVVGEGDSVIVIGLIDEGESSVNASSVSLHDYAGI